MTIDLRSTIAPKSDQMNADDLIGQTRTIKVTGVHMDGSSEQPVAIRFEGDNGKPYKPGKSMRRVMVALWGPDASKYNGRSMTLYRDDKVMFGGMAVGGIRISHMSHIDGKKVLALTVTRANKKPFEVLPLKISDETPAPSFDDFVKQVDEKCATATEAKPLETWWNSEEISLTRGEMHKAENARYGELKAKVAARIGELSAGGEV